MNTPRYATAAAKLIGKRLPVSNHSVGDQARGIATIERALRARTRRRRLAAAMSALAAAAAVMLAVQVLKPRPVTPTQVSIN